MKGIILSTNFGFLLVFLVVSFSLSASALTTFGKTSPQNPNPLPPPTPVGKAKECRVESDCAAVQNTTCITDPRDPKTMRCLCGDYSAPINGFCTNKFKGVGAPCRDHEECGEKAQCIVGNNTAAEKKCQCKEGYLEENFQCNGCNSISLSIGLVMGLLISLSMS